MSLKQNQLRRWSKWARQILTTRHTSLAETLGKPRRARERGLDFDVERLEVREMLDGQPLETITSDQLLPASDNLIVNGSFEQGDIRRGVHRYVDASIPAWVTSSSSDRRKFAMEIAKNCSASERTAYLQLEYRQGRIDSVYQDVQTTAGTEYLLTFDLRERCSRRGSVMVMWGGEVVAIVDASRVWEKQTLRVTANATGATRLEFAIVGGAPNVGPTGEAIPNNTGRFNSTAQIDDVRLYEIGDDILVNGSFEEGPRRSGKHHPDAIPGWDVIEDKKPFITTRRFARSSEQWFYLDMGTRRVATDGVRQTVATVPNTDYALFLDVAGICHRNGTVNVYWDGELVAAITPADRYWTNYALKVTANSTGQSVLELVVDTPNKKLGRRIKIDDIALHGLRPASEPVAPQLAPLQDVTVAEGTQLQVQASATDPDSTPSQLTYAFQSATPAGVTIDARTGLITWTPGESQGPSSYDLVVRVTDQTGLSDTTALTITVTEANLAPVLAPIQDRTINEEDTLSFLASATDADLPANRLTFSLGTGAPSGATINALSGQFSWTPTEAEGPGDYEFTVIVTDEAGAADQQSFMVHVNEVNQAPVLAPIDDRTISELDTLSFFVSASDNDLPPGDLVFSLGAGAPAGASIDAVTGQFTWTPTEAEGPGDYELTVIVTDSSSATDQRTFHVQVNEINQAPELAPISNVTLGLGEALQLTAQATDADLPAQALTFTLDSAPQGAEIDPQTGAITWMGTEIGTYEFLVRVTDDGQLFDTAAFQVTVSDEDCLFEHDAWLFNETGGSSAAAGSGQTVDCSIVLEEGDSFTVEAAVSFTVEATTQQFVFSYEALLFDLQSTGSVHDAVEVALLDSNGNSLVHTIGDGNDAFFNITEGEFVAVGANTLLDGMTVSLDLSHIAVGTTATLVFRLVNNDTDTQTTVRFNPLQFLATGLGTPVGVARAAAQVAGPIDNLENLIDVTPSVSVRYGQTSWNEADGVLFADVELTNEANYPVDGPYVLVVDQLSSPQVAVLGASGATDEGARYYVLSDATADGALMPGEATLTQRLQFFNPTGEPFTYRLTLLAQPNQAPEFTTAGNEEGLVGVTYAYDAEAVDADGDTVSYRLLAGPAGLTVDAATGQVTWVPTASDVGTHSVILEASDGRGGVTTQQYTLEVKTSVPNRPPVILSTPVVQTYLSGQSLFSNSTDPDADDPLTRFIELTPADVGSTSASRFSTLPSLDPGLFGLDYDQVQIVNFDVDPFGRPIANGAFITTQYESLNLVMNNFQVSATVFGGPASAPNATYTPGVPGEALVFDFVVPLRAVGFINTSPDQDRIEFLDSDGNVILSTRDQDSQSGPNFSIDRFLGYIADPERPIAKVRVLNNTGNLELDELIFVPVETSYQYDVDAVDADGDTIRYQLDEAPAGMTINSATGMISWNPTLEHLGTHTVRVTANDGRGGTATQEYQVQVLPDATNTAPQIVSDPVADFFIPGFSNPATGNVTPQRVALDLGNGEIFEGTVSITLPNSAARFADIVLAVDESGSMGGDQAWIAEMIPLLDAALIAEGIGADADNPNRFAVIGFGGGRDGIVVGHFINQQRPTRYRLYAPDGQLVSEGVFQDVVPDELLNAQLEQSGQYVLVVEAVDRADLVDGIDLGIGGALGAGTRTETLTLDTIVEDQITIPGQRVAYELTLTTPSLLYFDALAKDARLTWTLTGPAGVIVNGRPFTSSDTEWNLPLLELAAGQYTLTIDTLTDVATDYKFQMLDLSSAPLVESGQAVTGEFALKAETFAYRLPGTAGQEFELISQTTGVHPGSRWRLIDPHGDIIVNLGIGTNQPPLRLQLTGEYLLLMESALSPKEGGSQLRVDSEFTFTYQLTDPQPPQDLTLGATIQGTIDYRGDYVDYRFSLDQRSLLYLDALVFNDMAWTLDGPAGNVVNNRSLSATDSFNFASPVLELMAGDYTLRIAGNNMVGDYAFRLVDLDTATPIALDTTFSGELALPNETDFYQFSATAGDRIYVSVEAASDTANTLYRVVDPFGRIVSEQRSLTDEDTFALPLSGQYTLVVEGWRANTGLDTYSMQVRSVPVRQETLTLGTTVSGAITQPGDSVSYAFTLAEHTLVYFDSLTNNNAFNFTVTGPRGVEVNNRALTAADAQSSNSPVFELPPGEYQLTIDGTGPTTGAFEFVLYDILDPASATVLSPNPGAANPLVSVTGANTIFNATQIYHFTAVAGDVFTFDGTASGTTLPNYRVYDSYGNLAVSPISVSQDRANQVLTAGGTYVLLIEGQVADTTLNNFQLDLQYIQNDGPTVYSGTPLTLHTTVSGDLSTAGQSDEYTFTVTERMLFYLDALTNHNSIRWTLAGASGAVATNVAFSGTDSFNNSAPVYDLKPGDYQLRVFASSGTPGAYQFRAVDLASSTPITPGTEFSGELVPANGTDRYRFTATAGEKFYFEVLSASDVTNTLYRLITPLGEVAFTSNRLNDFESYEATMTGTYTLLVEGWRGNTGNDTYTMNVVPVVDPPAAALALGSPVHGSLLQPGQAVRYAFTLADDTLLHFDALTASNQLVWSLDGPAGNVIASRRFDQSDGTTANTVVTARPGEYVLTVTGNADFLGDFAFQLHDLKTQPSLTLGTPIEETRVFNNQAQAYQFTADAGDRLLLRNLQATGFGTTPVLRIVNAAGQDVFRQAVTSSAVFTVAQSGTYTLITDGVVSDTGTGAELSFQVDQLTSLDAPATAIAIGDVVSNSLSLPFDIQRYQFTLTEPSLVYFDSLTNTGAVTWSLSSGSKTFHSNVTLNGSDAGGNPNPVLSLPAGQFTLDLTSSTPQAYAFRVLNLSDAVDVSFDTAISGTLNPVNSTQLYHFTGNQGDSLYLDVLSATNPNSAVIKVIDPLGRTLANATIREFDDVTLPFNGDYWLLVEGTINASVPATYELMLLRQNTTTTPLTLNSTISGTLAGQGDRFVYTFELAAPTALYFDTLSSRSDVVWSLTGPSGTVVNNRQFVRSDSIQLAANYGILPAGSYQLTVDGVDAAVGDFAFRLLDVNTFAQQIGYEQTVTGGFSANETQVYQFQGAAGEQLLVDIVTADNLNSPVYRLYDPQGQLFDNANSLTDLDLPQFTATGTYTLLIESRPDTAAPQNYEFRLERVDTTTAAYTLGTLIDTTLAAAGDQLQYTFTLASDALLYFDAQVFTTNLTWTLQGPTGTVIAAQRFDRTDAQDNSTPVFEARAGNYTLTLDGTKDYAASVKFRLHDLAAATVLTPGTAVSGTLSSGIESALYRFTASAGDAFLVDALAGHAGASYRVIDPYGRVVFSSRTTTVDTTFTADFNGTYTLLVEGRISNTAAVNYELNLVFNGNTAPTPLSGTVIGFGSEQTGDLATAGQVDSYRFTLTERTLVYFDELSHGSTTLWSLTGPRGVEVAGRRFDRSNSVDFVSPVLDLVAGEYQLDVVASTATGTPGAYAFKLVDLASATALTPGTAVSGDLVQGGETHLYQFSAAAGDALYLDVEATADLSNALLRLIDPYGRTVASTNRMRDLDGVTAPVDGTYTLLVEGVLPNAGPNTYTVNVQPVTVITAPLVLNDANTGTIATAGDQLLYSFSLAEDAQFFFLPVTSSNTLNWTLEGLPGTLTAAVNFSAGPRLVPLVAGDYTVRVDATADNVGEVTFETYLVSADTLLDLAGFSSGALDTDTPVQIYQFSATAGQQFALLPDLNLQFGSSTSAADAAGRYTTSADPEDGYSGLDAALRADVFRPNAAVNYILVTDEDRDALEDNVSFGSLFAAFSQQDALLNAVVGGQFRNENNTRVIGVDSEGNAYAADGNGGFTVTGGGFVSSTDISTRLDYIDLAWATGGAAWDLGLLRAGGTTAQSFTQAFLDIKVAEIVEQTSLRLVSSDPAAPLEWLDPASGFYSDLTAGETYDFDIRITPTGRPQSFDLLFKQGQTIGSVPVVITAPYQYSAMAVDDDGDPLTWSLVEGPEGLMIDTATGQLSWTAANVAYGEHTVTVRVEDGRGGFDEQTYVLRVGGGEAGSISGLVYDAAASTTQTSNVIVPGNANPYLSGMPDGPASGGDSAPDQSPIEVSEIDFGDFSQAVVTFSATGAVSYQGEPAPTSTPDGDGAPGSSHNAGAENGISNFVAPVNSLVGVFLGPDQPNLTPAPETLDFSGLGNVPGGINYLSLAPQLQQLFFIGDGVNDAGQQQQVIVPEGATRLFLGTTDGFGWYNNGGFFSVDVTVTTLASANQTWDLYLDQNRNGIQDAGEQTTTTDEDGNFAFLDLAPGTYVVRQQNQPGWQQVVPGEGSYEIAVGEGQDIEDVLFGNQQAPEVNTDPVITSEPPLTVEAGEPFRYTPTITELDGDTLTFDVPLGPAGLVVNPTTGAIRWTPRADQIGTQAVLLRVRDGRGGYDLQYFNVEVLAPNSGPAIVSTAPTGPAGVNLPYEYQVVATDADNDILVYSVVQGPDGLAINAATGKVTWTPQSHQLGTHTITLRVEDGRGGVTAQTFELQVELEPANLAPVILSTAPLSAYLGDDYLYRVSALDPNGDPIAIVLNAAPAGMTITDEGLVQWEPTAAQVGDHVVRVAVSDGRGGTTEQEFTVSVKTQQANRAPQIISRPPTSAIAGRSYDVQIEVNDPDQDIVFFTLEEGPAGMSIVPFGGDLHWAPTVDDLGDHRVTIQATDTNGGYSQLTYVLRVRALNTPPVIVTAPPTSGAIGRTYFYQVGAEDVDEDRLTFTLQEAPEGMTIDANTGRIQWTPEAGQDGSHAVMVMVSDSFGASASQTYSIVVASGQPNRLPVITSTPGFFTSVGDTYNYDVDATDPDGDEILYSLLDAPIGMTIDDATGMISWAPQTGDLGTRIVEVVARDPAGGGSIQQFSLTVLQANDAPVITSTPPSSIAAGATFRYDVLATDPNGDFLTYELANGPAGMVIDGLGRMFWVAGTGMSGAQDVSVIVRDARGAAVNQNFTLTVAADTAAPQVAIQLSNNPVNVGSTVEIRVTAVDNVGVTNLRLELDGVAVGLDASGRARVPLSTVGAVTAVATATDAAGNVSTDTIEIFVADPNDVDGPVLEITSPSDGGLITAPTDVIGTVSDDTLVSYRLLLGDFATRQFREIGAGNANVDNSVLGTIDPTLLQNDTYILRLEAIDASGSRSVIEQSVDVTGAMKLGNYQLAFTDMVIPVGGLSVAIARTYDSLTSNTQGEFGFGWSLAYRDTNLLINLPKTGMENVGVYSPFQLGTRVYVTLPGGERQGFTFNPTLRALPGFGNNLVLASPRFTPDPGVSTTLSVGGGQLIVNEFGELYAAGGIPYNPASPDFGGTFTLTDTTGTRYSIDGNTGKLNTVTDRNGNTVRFTNSGIQGGNLSVTFERDSKGRIVSVADPAGNKVRYAYDASGDLVSVTDREDNATQFAYDATRPHFLASVTDPLGRVGVRSEYNGEGRLVGVRDVNGETVTFVYDPANFTATIADPFGNPNLIEYDSSGNVVASVDALGRTTLSEFDAQNRRILETNALGQTTQYEYNAAGRVTSVTDSIGRVQRYTYGANNQITSVTDALGHTTLFSLDGRGNVLQMTNALGEVTSYSYDSRGLVTSITDASGAQTTMNYDQHGREVLRTDAMGTEFHTQYDINGNPLTKSFMITVGNELVEVRAEAVYDRNGRAISLTDPAGFTSSVAYDRNGNQLSSSDPLGRTTSFVYDERGNRTEAILPNGLSVRQQFDAAGRPVNTERPGGITSTVGYDVAGQTTSVTEVGVPMGDTAQDVGVTLTYDALGRLIGSDDGIVPPLVREYDEAGNMVRVSSGAASMVQAYDAVGRITSTTDALGSTSIIDYDALGRASRIAYASGMEFTFTYDARGNIIATEDSIGRRVVQVYDALNRLTKVVLPDGSETTYGYNERGDLISVVDANGNETQYEYDLRGNRTATIRPLGGRDIYNYNAAGELTGVQWANGQSLTYVLDAMGRITEKRHGDVVVETLTYTEFGGVRSVIDTRGQTLFEYDDAGRLIQRTEPDGRFLRYNYSVDGNILALSSNDSLTTYEYNDLGQLESVTSDGATTVYQYDDLGRITTTTLPNGVVERRTFGVGDTVTRVWTERNGTVLSDIRYTYDEFARVLSQERVGSFLVTYSYDVNDRLLLEQYEAANGDTWSISYAYDAVGNRLVRVDSRSGTTMYTYNINDQLIAETTNGQTTTYVYDATGNLISKTDAARGVETYEWDGERRLTAVRTANGDQQFQYDLFGDRVASFDGDGETRYLLDAQREYTQVFEALNVPTSQVTSYVFGAGRIAVRTGSDVRYYHGDSQDSTRLLTDGNGAVLAKFDLDAYGNLLDDNAIGEQFLFAGEQRDLATGFDYLRARYYDPRLGRMLSVDPLDGLLSDPVTLHRYLYGNGSPTNFTDPSGEFSLTETLVSLGKISLLAGAITGTVGAAALAILGDRVWDGWQALMTISTSGMAGASPFGKLPDLGLTLGGSYLKAKFPNGDGGGFSLTGLHLIVATTFSSPNFPLLDKLDKAAGKAPASVRTAGNVAIPLTAFGWFPLAVAGALASYSPIDIAVAKTTVHAPDFYPGIAPISGPYISVLGTASAGIGLAPVGGLAGGGSAAAVGGLLQGFGFGYSILSPGFTIKPRLGIDLIAGLAIPVSPAIRKPL